MLAVLMTAQAASAQEPGCDGVCVRDWSEGCSSTAAPPVANGWAGPNSTDVTFLAFGDAHAGGDPADKNALNALALNAADARLNWTTSSFGVDAPVSHVRGVIMAGDITNDGRDGRYHTDDNIKSFTDVYGLCGNASLKFPIFEGYGNHDYFIYDHIMYRMFNAHPNVDMVSKRNPYRAGLTHTAPGADGHYSWDWDNVHFVMVNLAPTDLVPVADVTGKQDPRHALEFLQNDLAAYVAGTQKRVIVISHYGFYSSWDFSGWWTTAEAEAYYNVIKDYHVIAHLHGHAHQTGQYLWHGINVFNLGSPFYSTPSYNPDGRGHFTVFRVTDDFLYVGDAGWNPASPDNDIVFPAGWHAKIPLNPIAVSGDITCNVPPSTIREGMHIELTAPEGAAHRWVKDFTAMVDRYPRIAGTASIKLVFDPVRPSDAGLFVASYGDGAGALTQTTPFQMTVIPAPPVPAQGRTGLLVLGVAFVLLFVCLSGRGFIRRGRST